MMKNLLQVVVLPAALLLPLSLAACSRTVAEHENVHRNWDGSVSHDKTTVTEHPDGTRSVDKDHYRARD